MTSNSKVTVQADEQNNVIRVSKKNPEFGHINPGYDFVDPILELGAHVAPTGITFYSGDMFPPTMKNNLFKVIEYTYYFSLILT